MSTSNEFIPQIQPWIDHEEAAQLQRVIQSTYLTEHALTDEFQALTRKLTGAKHAIAVSNGTMALYCALKAVGVGPGDEVIVPDLTFIASANAVIMTGAQPVFCDVCADTFCIDVESAARVVTARTRAVMPVHLYVQTADMERVMAFAKAHKLQVVEDAAEVIGVTFNGKHAGTFGTAGTFSYYGNKTVTCGQGGMVVTDSDEVARKVNRLKNYGRDQKGVFVHEHIGFNFAFTDMQAAIGIAQMGKLDRVIAKKKAINDRYTRELGNLPGVGHQHIDTRCKPVFWFSSVLSDRRDELIAFLLKRNIQTRAFFPALHGQPCYGGTPAAAGSFPVSTRISAEGLSLPSSALLTEAQQTRVIQGIQEFYAAGH